MAAPITVAMLDSGIASGHPHLAGVHLSGFSLDVSDSGVARSDDFSDRTGHGTACAAAFHRLAPRAHLLGIRLLDDELRSTFGAVAAGIVEAASEGARVINLSLGSRSPVARATLAKAVEVATSMGAICVAAAHPRGAELWPADLDSVISAQTHRSCPLSDLYRTAGPLPRYLASGWPRPIEGRRPTDNLFGPSIAAVHVSARVTLLLEEDSTLDLAGVTARLDEQSVGVWKE